MKALSVGAIIRRKIFYDRSPPNEAHKKAPNASQFRHFYGDFTQNISKKNRERRKAATTRVGALTGTTTKYKDSDKNNPKCIHHF